MATDFISRELAIAQITALINDSGKYMGYESGAEDACYIVEHLTPAADVRPVEHGEWTYIAHVPFGHDYECSFCKQRNYEKSNFCPNCGAVMRDNPVIIFYETEGENAES